MSKRKLFYLNGKVQHYAWGGHTFLPTLLGLPITNKPCAEYWMGVHQNGPSTLEDGRQLGELIAAEPEHILGTAAARRFGQLPYLFKILDVKDMLSIQVHPTKAEAEKGFARENAAGIPIDAPHRNYKDANHKPEIMVALSDFWLLHGFLPEDRLVEVLRTVPEFASLESAYKEEGYQGLYRKVMEMPQEEVNTLLQPLADRTLPLYNAGKLDKNDPYFWAGRAIANDPDGLLDRGIFSIFFFNVVYVKPGEAVFQDAGIPHAYLEGQNVELMANSDNVLRGGLTPKHIDVEELIKHTRFEAVHPAILEGETLQDGQERIYNTPAPDFVVSSIHINTGETYAHTASGPETWMVMEGAGKANELTLEKGKSIFVPYGTEYQVTAETPVTIFKASIPL